MAADFGPCADWPVRWTCDVSTESPTATGMALSAATRVVWALSGRRFGTCEVTLRPCRRECYGSSWPGGWLEWSWSTYSSSGPSLWDSSFWVDAVCGSCSGGCSCAQVSEVVLPTPVNQITAVKVDGSPLATGAYQVYDNSTLVRTDGGQWPRCNNLNLGDDQPGTWSVTATYGEDVPESGQFAVGEMACEILKASRGEDCRLPPGVTQLVRQGVTISYPDVGELLKEGRTGLYLVDLFLASENPARLAVRPRVYSVDRALGRRPS